MRLIWAPLVVAVTAAVAGCQPVNVVGTYGVEERAVFEDNGQTVEVIRQVRCTILEFPHAIEEARFSARQTGAPIWVARADGSLLVIEYDAPCQWTQMPAAGETVDLRPSPENADYPFHSLRGLLFNDARRPTRVSDLNLSGEGAEGLRLITLTATTGPDAEPSGGFERAFPAWSVLDGARTEQAILDDGRWVTIQAAAMSLPDGACEGEETVIVTEREQLPECAATLPWPYEDTKLQPIPDARFARVELVPLPAGRFQGDRFPATELRRVGAPTIRNEYGDEWAPDVCMSGRCISGEQMADGAWLLDMEHRRLVTAYPWGNRLSNAIEDRID